MAKKNQEHKTSRQSNALTAFSLLFFRNARFSVVLWGLLLLLGVLSYTTWLQREGFPAIRVPVTLATGTYFADDAAKVDNDVLQPISETLASNDQIESYTTTAQDNFFTIVANFDESIESQQASDILRTQIDQTENLPKDAQFEYVALEPAKYLNKYDMVIALYDTSAIASVEQLEEKAAVVVERLQLDEAVESAEVNSQISSGRNPVTGVEEKRPTSFSRFGSRESGELAFNRIATVGVNSTPEFDVIEASDAVQVVIAEVEQELNIEAADSPSTYKIAIAADFAPAISTQIQSLQNNMLTGLLAVAAISLLLITWRASIVTGLFMVSVMAVTLFALLLIGYTLNTITLFALVLSLGLFVDDATIIVEAIDASRKKSKKATAIVSTAIRRVAAASFAGTATTVLVFLPLAFVSGILGEFIRIMPITIIVALITSLVLSLTLIPLLSKFILLRREKEKQPSLIGRIENVAAEKLSSLPLIFRRNRKSGIAVSIAMILVSVGFLIGAQFYASKLAFNIFPPTKDSDELLISLSFDPGSTIDKAERVAERAELLAKQAIGSNIENIVYLAGNERGAEMQVSLTPFTQRDVKSPELIRSLRSTFESLEGAEAEVNQLDAGPPADKLPFKVQIYNEDSDVSVALADDVLAFLENRSVVRPNGQEAKIVAVEKNFVDSVVREDGRRYVQVAAGFDADDVSALVVTARDLVQEEFDAARLAGYGLTEDSLAFDFGQESENQDSFSSMGTVGLLSVIAMFVLLAIQFRSLIQPLLIFLAIPFSLFGVTFGLYITDNPISFFSMIGFFGLIGIAVNNTILLTDYANQERRQGSAIIESISAATKKRFRPLLTTTLTTVAALLPLAMSDPFWEALAYTIIFGLLSSTFLVLVSFPFYYLYVEAARTRVGSFFTSVRSRG